MTAMAKEDDRCTYMSDSEISDNGFADVLKKVNDVKSDDKSEEGENVILQARLSKRLLEWLHWSLKLNMCRAEIVLCEKKIIITNGDWKQRVFWVDN